MNALCPVIRTARSLAVALLVTGCAALALGQAQPAPGKDDKSKAKTEDKAKIDDKTKTEDKAKTDDKTPAESPETKARRAFLENKFDDAAYKHLQEAVKANPELGTPEVVLSRWLAEAKKPQEARTMLERAASLNGDHPEVYLLNAIYALNDNRITEAILDLSQVRAAAVQGPWSKKQRERFQKEADNGLAAAYERRGNWAAARQYLQSLNESDEKKNPQVLQRLARANFLIGNDADALENLRAAFAIDKTLDPPELTIAQQSANRWANSQDAKDLAKVEEWYKKALNEYAADKAMGGDTLAKERAAKVYRGFAIWQLEQGNVDAAKAQLDTVKKLDPNSADTKIAEGIYFRHIKKPVEAANAFDDALRINPSNPVALANFALALTDANRPGDRPRALGYAELYKNQNPQNADAYAVLGYCLFKQDKIDEADQALTIALRAGQITPDTGYYIAALLAKREKWTQAEEILKKILEQKRPFIYKPEAQELLATVQKKLPPATPKK